MKEILRQLVLPIFLFLCLVLGGSSRSVWGLLALQILAVGIIAWAAMSSAPRRSSEDRDLLVFLLLAFLLIAIQLIPMPPAMWTALPGRETIEAGYRALGQRLPWLPLSLTPYATLGSVLLLLPPTAVVLGVVRLGAYRESWAAAAIFAGTLAGILLGYVQVVAGSSGESSWYLYEITNVGSAVGFFANRNHMGTLLVMTLPFLVPLFFARERDPSGHAPALKVIGLAGLMAILLGIAVNGSLAAIVLAVPVIAASALLLPALRRFHTVFAAIAAVAAIGALVVLASSPVQPKLTGESVASFEGRWQIWRQTWEAIGRSFPVGTGIGSFAPVYASLEPPETVTRVYVNHAHNDYLELLAETGLAGALLVVAFLGWWIRRARFSLRWPVMNRYAGAAAIASGAALAHSVVDYPLRTAAIAATLAFCLAIMVAGPARERTMAAHRGRGSGRPRHVRIG